MATIFYRPRGQGAIVVIACLLSLFSSITQARAQTGHNPESAGLEAPGVRLQTMQAISGEGKETGKGAPRPGEAAGLRLKISLSISEENMVLARQAVIPDEGLVPLVRLEPSTRRKRVVRKVWKPWAGALLYNLTWGGYVYEYYQKQFIENAEDQWYNTLGAKLKINSKTFIWRPWFASVEGGIGGTGSLSSTTKEEYTSQGLVGNLSFEVFPFSRFPFRAEYVRDRSDQSGEFRDTTTEQERYAFQQKYQTLTGAHFFAAYDHSDLKQAYLSGGGGETSESESITENYVFNAFKNFDKHSLNLNSSLNKSRRVDISRDYDTMTIVGLHRYTPTTALSVENDANYYNIHDRSSSETSGRRFTFDTSQDVIQVMSNTFWRPADKPLSVNGGIRYYGQIMERSTDIDGAGGDSSSVTSASGNMNVGASYAVSRNVNAFGSFNYSQALDPPDGPFTSNQTAGITYTSDEMDLLRMKYSWNNSASIQHKMATSENTLVFQELVGHGLRKDMRVGRASSLNFNVNQAFSVSHHARAAHDWYYVPYPQTQENMTHSASAGWTSQGEWGRGRISVTASDNRSRGLGGTEEELVTQLVYFQANIDKSLGKYSLLYADWVSQYSNSNLGEENDERVMSRGLVSFRNYKLFGMRGLFFYSELRVEDESYLPQFGDGQERESLSWENGLEYRIGKIQASAMYRMAEYGSHRRDILMLRILRNFGN